MDNSHRALQLGLLSHLCAASFPFLAKSALGSLGAYRGALLIYVVAVSVGWGMSLRAGKAAIHARAIAKTLRKPKSLAVFGAMMTLATVSVLLFYVGLSQSNPGEFSFVVRLEHLFALSLGFLALGERGRFLNILGALIGFSGWMLVINFGSVQGKALWYAIGYIVCSGAATMLAQVMLRSLSDRSFFLLRMSTTMLTLAAMTVLLEEQRLADSVLDQAALLSTILSGVVLAALFLNRYYAMSRIPLWWYSSLSATQMVFTPLFAWMTGKPLTWQVFLGGAIVTFGVTLASIPLRPKEPEAVTA